MNRRVTVWICAALALACGVVAVIGFAVDPRFGEQQGTTLSTLAIFISLALMPAWRRPPEQRVVERSQCSRVALAPLVLMVEWFLVFASLSLALGILLSPFSPVPLLRFFLVASQIALLPLALLPFANALLFLVLERAKRARLQRFKLIQRAEPGSVTRRRMR